jgi:molybdate transport system regulatory protein
MKARLKVWVVFNNEVKFGDGRAEFLELVDRMGSIKQAVDRFGMSYRNAWGYLRELEKAAGFKVIERPASGGPASGTRLTRKGKEFLARYRRFRQGLDALVDRRFARVFLHKG